MPRRPAKVTQADIARAIRAAKEAGAHSVTIDSEGLIRIELAENTGSNKLKRDSTKLGLSPRRCNGTSSESKADELRPEGP